MTREALKARWTTRRNELRETDAWVNGAMICAQLLADLERLWTEEDSSELTLREAARASGYSSDHLRRLVRLGRLPAQHRGRRLFFLVGDLPRKPAPVDVRPKQPYDPDAHARQVAIRRSRGGSIHDAQEAA
jgi:hypothetical protein